MWYMRLIGGAISAYYTDRSAKAKKREEYYNSARAVEDAKAAKQWADFNERQDRKKSRYRRGQMIVDLLKSGVTIDVGTTASALLIEQEVQDEISAITIRRKGASTVNLLMERAALFRARGSTILSLSKIQRKAAFLGNGGGAALGGLSDSWSSRKATDISQTGKPRQNRSDQVDQGGTVLKQ